MFPLNSWHQIWLSIKTSEKDWYIMRVRIPLIPTASFMQIVRKCNHVLTALTTFYWRRSTMSSFFSVRQQCSVMFNNFYDFRFCNFLVGTFGQTNKNAYVYVHRQARFQLKNAFWLISKISACKSAVCVRGFAATLKSSILPELDGLLIIWLLNLLY